MPDPVYASTITLDGSQYLATNAKVLEATAKIDASLARLRAQFAQILTALAPLQAGLGAAAAALGALGNDRATDSLRSVSGALAGITERAEGAAIALEDVANEASGAGSALEGDEGPGDESAQHPRSDGPGRPHRGAERVEDFASHVHTVGAGAAAVGALDVQQTALRGVEQEERRVEQTTRELAEAVTRESSAHQVASVSAHEQSTALTETAARQEHAAASTHRLAQETRDAGLGFRGLGENARKAGELIRDALLAVPEVAAVVGVFASLEEVTKKISESFSYGDQLNAMARETGQSAEAIAALRRTFQYFDVDAGSVTTTLFMMQRALGGVSDGGEPTAAAFGRIGLSIQQLKAMEAPEAFAAIQRGLATLPDQADRANVAMKIFGRSALEVQSILNASPADFAESMSAAREYANVMGSNAGMFEEIERKFFVLNEQVETVFAKIAGALAPAIGQVLDLVNQVDFSKWGDGIAGAIRFLTNAFGSGQITDLIGTGLRLAFEEAVNFLVNALAGIPDLLNAIDDQIFNPDKWTGIAQMLKGAAEAFGAGMMEAVKGPINAIISAANYLPDKAVARQALGSQLKIVGDLQKQVAADDSHIEGLGNQRDQHKWGTPEYQHFDELLKAAGERRDRDQNEASKQVAAMQDMAATAKESFSDYVASHQNDDITLGGKSHDQLVADSGTDITEGSAKASADLAPIGDAIKSIFSEGKGLQLFTDNPDLRARLADLYKILSAIPKADDVAKRAAPAINEQTGYNYKLPEGDRLAKVGLFLGSAAASPGLSELRRTANATEATAKAVARIVNVTGGRPGQTTAVYM
jgi:hypothetical protein